MVLAVFIPELFLFGLDACPDFLAVHALPAAKSA